MIKIKRGLKKTFCETYKVSRPTLNKALKDDVNSVHIKAQFFEFVKLETEKLIKEAKEEVIKVYKNQAKNIKKITNNIITN